MIDAAEVERILRNDDAPDSVRGDAWDATMQSATHWHLADSLRDMPLADETKRQLLRAKFQSLPAAVRAIGLMETMDRADLDRAERNPHVLSAMFAANGDRK